MFGLNKRLGIFPLLIGLGIAGSAVAGGQTGKDTTADMQCGIAKTVQSGMMTLEAVVLTQKAASGSYQLSLNSRGNGGSSTIDQGGDFSAIAHQVTTLGQMSIDKGSRYDLDFTITINGTKIECDQPFDYRT